MRKQLDRDPCFFHYGDAPMQGPCDCFRGLGRVCEGCGGWVRESRVPCHGMPKATKKQRLKEDEEDNVLMVAARQGVYIHGSPLHLGGREKYGDGQAIPVLSLPRQVYALHNMLRRPSVLPL